MTLLSSVIINTVAMNQDKAQAAIYSKSDYQMYCYHLSWILPLSGAGQCCPNMPIMTLSACISPHRTQVFHLVTTSSLILASDWLLIITLTSDWLIVQDMIRSPIAGYLNQIADN